MVTSRSQPPLSKHRLAVLQLRVDLTTLTLASRSWPSDQLPAGGARPTAPGPQGQGKVEGGKAQGKASFVNIYFCSQAVVLGHLETLLIVLASVNWKFVPSRHPKNARNERIKKVF